MWEWEEYATMKRRTDVEKREYIWRQQTDKRKEFKRLSRVSSDHERRETKQKKDEWKNKENKPFANVTSERNAERGSDGDGTSGRLWLWRGLKKTRDSKALKGPGEKEGMVKRG